MRSFLLAVSILMFVGTVVSANEGVAVGNAAPKLSYDEWVKGPRVTKFDDGTAYVVEFWGTWCGPCLENIPRLSRLQKQYQREGLVVIGVASHEFKGRPAFRQFMAKRGHEMAYRIAFDADQSMERDWDTGGKEGVRFRMPLCFVIDRQGSVAFVGHPEDAEFERSVAAVVAKPVPH
jgi:thiol-disulfide isomerase/thioredoxin